MDPAKFTEIKDALRYHILKMTHAVASGHPTSSFSAVDLMAVLFFKYLRFDTGHPEAISNDRVVFSKGHASALFYALYHLAGALSEEELYSYRRLNSPLEGHPTFRFPFAEAATGSLGQGLSVSAGLAWAIRERLNAKSQMKKTADPRIRSAGYDATVRMPFSVPRVFCLMGDGESASGQVYEALAWAKRHALNNLIAVVDVNRFGQSQETLHAYDLDGYRRKFEAFGWGTIVIDGHDFSQIDAAFEKAICYKSGPSAILARTRKGQGISVWEDQDNWHNRMLPPEELAKALEVFAPKTPVSAIIRKPDFEFKPVIPPVGVSQEADLVFYDPKVKVATKHAFGQALVKLGRTDDDLIVLDGDVANSTETAMFRDKQPARFMQMFIMEQNMASVAVGLAKCGFKPVISTFAAFLSRAHDQFRMIPLSDVAVMVNGAYGGISLGYDGPSQAAVEDLALFRSLAGSVVLYPSDPYQTEYLVGEMVKLKGVSYLRTTREKTPVIYKAADRFPVGGSRVLVSDQSKGKPLVAAVVAAGITVHEALAAQLELVQKGVHIRVIDCYSVKPLDTETLVRLAVPTGNLLVAEDHRPEGGLGEAVLSALAGAGPFKFVHLAVRKLSRSGSPAELLRDAGIDRDAIGKNILDMLK